MSDHNNELLTFLWLLLIFINTCQFRFASFIDCYTRPFNCLCVAVCVCVSVCVSACLCFCVWMSYMAHYMLDSGSKKFYEFVNKICNFLFFSQLPFCLRINIFNLYFSNVFDVFVFLINLHVFILITTKLAMSIKHCVEQSTRNLFLVVFVY